MTTKRYKNKPKGWRKIVVNNIEYWWTITRSYPYIKCPSTGKVFDTWKYCVSKGWAKVIEDGYAKFTPADVEEMIWELVPAE